MTQTNIVWSVAGSDSGAGAGLQADLRAFDAFGLHGCTAVSAITAQNSVAVERVEPVSAGMLDAQLAALASDMPPAAIKTGLLGSADNVRVLVRWIDRLRERHPGLPVVVDPVLRASTGASFADEELIAAYRRELLPRASLVTPNRREAAALIDSDVNASEAAIERAAAALVAMGCGSAVITGGDEGRHDDNEESCDFAITPHATGWLRLPRVATQHNHGTGCVFSSSAAAAIALGFVEMESIVLAKMATTHALRGGRAAGAGPGGVRPQPGFALHAGLPGLSSHRHSPGLRFAPLTDARLDLYAIVDSAAWVQRVLRAGVRTVQLRIKEGDPAALRAEIRASVAAARAANAQLFINDHWQLAIDEGAYGVHLGQEDLAIADLPALSRKGIRLGISTHAFWEVCRAVDLNPSYIACGPIHATRAKKMPWLPQGESNLAYWCGVLPTPVVAIGGMDADRAREAMRAGASGVAVIAAITGAREPDEAARELARAIQEGRAAERRVSPPLPRPTLNEILAVMPDHDPASMCA